MSEPGDVTAPRLGAWARTGGFTGLFAGLEDGEATLFDPVHRQMTRAPLAELEILPAAAVTVSLQVDLPLAHGLEEGDVRRWLASLTDEVLRDRLRTALMESRLDDGAALPSVRLTVGPSDAGGAVCLCGARTPAPDGARVACARCGRDAVARPASGTGSGDDVLGIS